VIDLSNNEISLPIHEFYNYVIVPLKKLTKLEFLALIGNPIQESIKEFKLFVINDLTRLKYIDWEVITKEVQQFPQKILISSRNEPDQTSLRAKVYGMLISFLFGIQIL
jgi:hypothetical protein